MAFTLFSYTPARRAVFVLGTLLLAACIDKPLPTQSSGNRLLRVSIRPSLARATSPGERMIEIQTGYLRGSGERVPLATMTTPVVVSVGQQVVPLSIDLGKCLADEQQSGPPGSCPLRLTLVIRDSTHVLLDSTEWTLAGAPGATVTIETPTIGVSPAGIGLRDATVYRFAASHGSLTSPTVTWDFGDGSSAAGDTVTHVFRSEGAFRVRASFGGSTGGGASGVNVSVGSLTGLWSTNPNGTNGVSFWLSIIQQGATLTGQYLVEVLPTSTAYTGNNWAVSSPLTGAVTSPLGVSVYQGGECLRAMDAGTVSGDLNTITGTYVDGNVSCGVNGQLSFLGTFTRVPGQPIASISVAPTANQVAVGGTTTFRATVSGPATSNLAVGWTSSNPNIASVTGAGTILGVRVGTATVTAWALADPTKTATATLTVVP